MSNTTIVAVIMAMALIIASVHAEAANGLSKKQVRTIVKQEVAKIGRIQGPAGPAGPAGMPGPQGATGPAGAGGFSPLFANIQLFGTVHGGIPSRGITDANVRLVDTDPNDQHYCFSGLPPVSGG